MLNHLSPAQALPIDVLRSIIKWIVGENQSPFRHNNCNVSLLKELLTVSSAWRQAALESQWREVRLAAGVTTRKVLLNRPKWAKSNTLPHYATNLVRKVHISVSLSGIVLGEACKLLIDYLGSTKCLPSAYEFNVTIHDYKDDYNVSSDLAIANTLELANLIKSLAPKATTANMICDNESWELYNHSDSVKAFDEDVLRTIADVLYANTKRANLELLDVNTINQSTIVSIPPLSKIKLYCRGMVDTGISLIHKSTSTLEYLDIDMHDPNTLLCDMNGEPVAYPTLQHLKLGGCVRNSAGPNNGLAEMIHFPVLKTLRLNSLYPFHDDVVFRGNSATLEYLTFRLDYDTIVMSSKKRIFESKNRALRQVNIDMLTTSVNAEFDVNKFLINLVGSAERLSVMNSSIARVFIAAAQYGQGLQNIKVFDIRTGVLSVSEVLGILRALPVLIELRCVICGVGPELESIAAEELPDHIATAYRDIGKNLHVWKTQSTISTNIDCVLILALVCPKLWRIQLKCGSIKDAHVKIAAARDGHMYSRYAAQLSRLLDIFCEL